MEQQLALQAQKLFELAKKAGLLAGESFSEVFPEETIGSILERIERDKAIFVSDSDLATPEKLWEAGVGLRIQKEVSGRLMDFLIEINKAFMVNYDQPLEDVIFNFQSVSSDLSIADLGESQEDGEFFQSMKIGDETFQYKSEESGLVTDALYDISRKLLPLSKSLINANFGDQNQYLVVDTEFASDFADFDFSTI